MRAKILRAGSWTIVSYGITQGTRLLSSLILTRLLVPEVFGIMAIAMVMNTGLTLFSDIGLLQSVVRSKRGDDRNFLDTLWVVQILRGFAICIAALLLAVGLAGIQSIGWLNGDSVYSHPVLPYVIGAIGFTAVLAGFESTKVAVARRELLLARLSQLEIFSVIAVAAITIVWAWIDRSIWALVGGWIIGAALRTILTHAVLPGMGNRFHWDTSAIREVVDFGKWVLVSSMFTFLVTSGDRLILSSFFSSRELGIYSIAYLILNAVQLGISRLAAQIAYPALSKIVRDQPQNVLTAYYKVRLPIDWFCLGVSGFLFAGGEGVVGILYDARYADAGGMLAVLALILIGSRYEVAEQVFLALGKSRLLAIINAVRMITLYVVVPAAYFWAGVNGAIWGIVVASLLPLFVTLCFCRQNAIVSLRQELSSLYAFPVGFIFGTGMMWFLRSNGLLHG